MISVRLVGGPLAGIEFLDLESAGPPGGRCHQVSVSGSTLLAA
ncbi:hypothetical protein ACIQ6K_32525 [Streptomyces sp. NPDC096354]